MESKHRLAAITDYATRARARVKNTIYLTNADVAEALGVIIRILEITDAKEIGHAIVLKNKLSQLASKLQANLENGREVNETIIAKRKREFGGCPKILTAKNVFSGMEPITDINGADDADETQRARNATSELQCRLLVRIHRLLKSPFLLAPSTAALKGHASALERCMDPGSLGIVQGEVAAIEKEVKEREAEITVGGPLSLRRAILLKQIRFVSGNSRLDIDSECLLDERLLELVMRPVKEERIKQIEGEVAGIKEALEVRAAPFPAMATLPEVVRDRGSPAL